MSNISNSYEDVCKIYKGDCQTCLPDVICNQPSINDYAKQLGENMKTLLIGLSLIATVSFNVQANTFLNSFKVNKGTSTMTYTKDSLKRELQSSNVSCFTINRKVYISKGYKAKFGNTKAHCTTKRAKVDGVNRITKNNLTTKAFIELNKS